MDENIKQDSSSSSNTELAEGNPEKYYDTFVHFGSMGLRTLVILNGGVLTAIPVYAKLLTGLKDNLESATIFFIISLSCTLLAMYVAFLNFYSVWRVSIIRKGIKQRGWIIWRSVTFFVVHFISLCGVLSFVIGAAYLSGFVSKISS